MNKINQNLGLLILVIVLFSNIIFAQEISQRHGPP